MALLVGDNTNHATARGMTTDVARYMTDGYVAAATGSATSARVKADNWAGLNTSRIKVIVFHGGSQIAISDEGVVPATTPGEVTCAFSSPPTITSGQTYYLAIIANNGTMEIYDDNNTFNSTDCGGTYSFADPSGATFSGAGNASGRPNVYLDGTAGGSSPFGPESSALAGQQRMRRIHPALVVPQNLSSGLLNSGTPFFTTLDGKRVN